MLSVRRFDSLEEYDHYSKSPLWVFYCSNHKNMLLAKALRDADHKFLKMILELAGHGNRDSDEFRTTNLIDMVQIQLHKLFGHTKESYAHGHGVQKFPAWMQEHHHNKWRGLDRLVGNRAQIFLENAVCMYHMATYYLEYCRFCIEQSKESNRLHTRVAKKLSSAKVMSTLRARAIMFVQISQPLRVAANCKKYCGGNEPTQLDVAPLWVRAYNECRKLSEDPSPLLNRHYNIFEGIDSVITETIEKYRTAKRNAPMLDSVFGVPDCMYREVFESLQMHTLVSTTDTTTTLLVLKADAVAAVDRLK